MSDQRLGVDIGGSGIKGAPVECETGELVRERLKIATPKPSTPEACALVVNEIVHHFDWHGPIGVTFPGVVTRGTVRTAANMHKGWLETDAEKLFGDATGCKATVLNDADAAGVAELRFGGHPTHGVVLMITLGTGIGSALFLDGVLVPNTELGHVELNGKDAEETAAARIREERDLSWPEYTKGLSQYLRMLESLLWPDLIIIGGGISRRAEKFLPHLDKVRTPVVAAKLQNEAGIVGAALAIR
jgi:polyphosphate glucokinase